MMSLTVKEEIDLNGSVLLAAVGEGGNQMRVGKPTYNSFMEGKTHGSL